MKRYSVAEARAPLADVLDEAERGNRIAMASKAFVPKIRRQHLPPALFQHLLERIERRKIPASQLELLAKWLDSEPEVPEGEWYKRFGMTVCGEGELVKTFLLPGQHAKGHRVS